MLEDEEEATDFGNTAAVTTAGTATGIVLFTTRDSFAASYELKKLLERSGCPFCEQDGTNADVFRMLAGRFGSDVTLPGMILDDCLWIPAGADNVLDLIHEYVVDKVLRGGGGGEQPPTSMLPVVVPSVKSPKRSSGMVQKIPRGQDITTLLPQMRHARHEAPLPTAHGGLRIVGKVVTLNPGDRRIALPGTTSTTTTTVTVTELTRLLLAATPHREQPRRTSAHGSSSPTSGTADGRSTHCYAFRGSEGIVIWKQLFGGPTTTTASGIAKGQPDDDDDDDDDQTWIQFGLTLMEHGIVHSYNPDAPHHNKDLRQAYLVLQPLRDARCLNSLLQWPRRPAASNKQFLPSEEDATGLILRLSRMMDAVCSIGQNSNSSNCDLLARHPLFLELEEAVCQLQGISVPDEPQANAAFALNLHNLMVRHAMIRSAAASSSNNNGPKWTWPTSLEEMHRFSERVGYTIDGAFISIWDLRMCLFGCTARTGDDLPKLVTSTTSVYPKKRWLFAACYGRGKTSPVNSYEDVFYDGAVIQTDVRILMAMAWGTMSSPVVRTVYPDRLGAGLQTAARNYCQTQVAMEGSSVVLPVLLSWYRSDFGKSPETVLRSIKDFLSEDQKQQIRKSHRANALKITFHAACPSDWQCGLTSSMTAKDPAASTTLSMKREIAPANSIADFSLYTSLEASGEAATVPAPESTPKGIVAKQLLKSAPGSSPTDSVAKPLEQAKPKHVAADIETGGFPLKQTDLRRSESDQSNSTIGVGSLGLLRRWMVGRQTSIVEPMCTRQASVGDAKLSSPGRNKKSATEHTIDFEPSTSTNTTSNTSTGGDTGDDDGHSWYFKSDVSAMTLGSEFDILIDGFKEGRPACNHLSNQRILQNVGILPL